MSGQPFVCEKMKKFWFISALLLWLSSSLAMAQTCTKLTVTGPPVAAPASWVIDGKLVGAAVEYVEIVSRASGIKDVEFRSFPSWSDSLRAVYRGEVDVIFSTNWTEERERYLEYIRPSMSSQFLNVVVRRGEGFAFNSLEDLVKRSGAAPQGETYGDGHFGQFVTQKLKLQRAPDISKVIDLLLEQNIDYIFGYENAIFSQLATRNLGSTLQILNTYPTRAEGFIAFSKRSRCGAEVRQRFSDQVILANSKHTYRGLMVKYREMFNETLTRPR